MLTSELIVKWWRWFLAGEDMPPDVFFAATKRMTPNDKEVLDVHYSNTTTISKPVLVNVDKWISLGFDFTPDDLLIKIANERIDMLTKMNVVLDGKEIAPQRMASPIFEIELKQEMQLPELGPKKIPKGRYKAYGDGYWVYTILYPPNKEHTIETFASCRLGRLSLGIRHNFKPRV